MGFSVHWLWLAALSCLLCMGGEVRCECTEENMQMAGGDYTLTKKLERGSTLIYNCPEDYYPYPDLIRHCQPSGTWTPKPKRFLPQRCKMVECPDPNVMEYGTTSPLQENYFVHNVTTYECYSGYTMRGSSTRVCLTNGKWSGSTPICSRDSGDTCADPGIPPGATRTGNSFGIDDRVKYSCNGKLFLVGSSERVCQENGQWTGKEPACYYRHTYDTPLEVSQAFGSAIKDSLINLQSINDTQEGRSIRLLKNETLNIFIAVDISESIEESHISKSRDAIVQLISKIASFSVSPNYEVVFFSSDVIEVVKILDFMDGKKVRNTIIDELKNFKLTERNSAGTDLNLVFKTFLERMALIKTRVGEKDFETHRHVIILFTDGAYNMGGSPAPTLKRIKDMVYNVHTNHTNHTSEEAAKLREDYLDIYIFAIGAEVLDDDLQPLAVGKGKHYFRMKDIENFQHTLDEIIDENEVQGLCGLSRGYDTDNPRKMYPWMAFITVKNNDKTKKCIGSLVTPQFVLTAAHCFTFGNVPQDVTVDIKDGQGIVKKVRKFSLHPYYNINAKVNKNVKEFYDYDVALIQLEDYVQISTTVRPICIPCTQDTSDALKLVGVSSCIEQEQILLKTHLERLSFLTRSGNNVREKTAHAKIGDNRDECIRHALKAPGISTDNPKEAVTNNFLCTGGRSPQRDNIACPGDSGGAVFKSYENRTIQIALVSWGTKDLCATYGNMPESDDTSRDFHINLFRVVPFLKSILGDDDQNEYAPLKFLEN